MKDVKSASIRASMLPVEQLEVVTNEFIQCQGGGISESDFYFLDSELNLEVDKL